MKSFTKVLLAGTAILVITAPAFSQLEIAGGGGAASYRSDGVTQNKGKFLASVSGDLGRFVAVGFEYGFVPLANETESSGGVVANGTEHFNTYGFVARVGLLPSRKLQPFVEIVGGGLRDTATVSATSGGTTYSNSQSESGGYFGGGGGINLGVGGGWGVRPEFRYQHVSISQGGSANEMDFLGSLYYTFGGRHHRK